MVHPPGRLPAAGEPRRRARREPARPWPILGPVKLLFAIVHAEDAGILVDALLDKEFRTTRLQSSVAS